MSDHPAVPARPDTISLHIINRYLRYPTHQVRVDGQTVPAPPIGHRPATAHDQDALAALADEHLYPYTGTGHPDGASFYDVTVTASSATWLVGHVFAWGY